MRKLFALVVFIVAISTSAYAVPALQLFISGATYNWASQTWVTHSGDFDLYVVSANNAKNDVIVSLALDRSDNPNIASVNFDGHQVQNTDWVYGFAPIDNEPDEWNGGDDLPRHGIFPTWFTEMHTGAYGLGSQVGDTQPNFFFGNFWNPATGDGYAPARGEVKMFHIVTGGTYSFVHFDAYTLNSDGSIDQFAPFSHDAETVSSVPEPATLALLGTGLLGLGGYVRRRRHL